MSESTAVLDYHRLIEDADGVSRFVDGEIHFQLEAYSPPAPPIGVHRMPHARGLAFIVLPAGAFEDWHPAPRRQFIFTLRGVVEVTSGSGEVRRLHPGSVILVEDTDGNGHTTRVVGDEDHFGVAVPLEG